MENPTSMPPPSLAPTEARVVFELVVYASEAETETTPPVPEIIDLRSDHFSLLFYQCHSL